MKNNQLFLPINNHYTGIDLPTLKSNNFISMHPGQDNVNLKRKRVNLSPVLNIAKYGLELKQDNISKGEVILNSKKIISQIIKLYTFFLLICKIFEAIILFILKPHCQVCQDRHWQLIPPLNKN